MTFEMLKIKVEFFPYYFRFLEFFNCESWSTKGVGLHRIKKMGVKEVIIILANKRFSMPTKACAKAKTIMASHKRLLVC
jgi:hypothetical protein